VVSKLTIAPGVFLWREKFSPLQQKHLLGEVMARLKQAPLYRPVMPKTGKAFSVEESNFGQLGWVSDKSGYRYQPAHPVTGAAWPDIPSAAWISEPFGWPSLRIFKVAGFHSARVIS